MARERSLTRGAGVYRGIPGGSGGRLGDPVGVLVGVETLRPGEEAPVFTMSLVLLGDALRESLRGDEWVPSWGVEETEEEDAQRWGVDEDDEEVDNVVEEYPVLLNLSERLRAALFQSCIRGLSVALSWRPVGGVELVHGAVKLWWSAGASSGPILASMA